LLKKFEEIELDLEERYVFKEKIQESYRLYISCLKFHLKMTDIEGLFDKTELLVIITD
jgi:hypothetical protein